MLADHPATGGDLGAAIWAAHRARAASSLARARSGSPLPFAARQDPVALRALLLSLLIVSMVSGGASIPARLAAAFSWPGWPFPGPGITIWVTPPAYAGQAPEIAPKSGVIRALQGSAIAILLNGSNAAIHLRGGRLSTTRLGNRDERADGVILTSGQLSIGPWWHRIGHWQIQATPPSAPALSLAPVVLAGNRLQLSWTMRDDYGLTALRLVVMPAGYPAALPEGTSLPLAAGRHDANIDMRDSPYAGRRISVVLQAVNQAGRQATTTPQFIALPPDHWHDPTARALSHWRQQLALLPAGEMMTGARLMQIAAAPPSAISFAADAQLAGLATGLRVRATSPEAGVTQLLALITQIEAGPDYQPRLALRQAARALLAALSANNPNPAALQRLLAQLNGAVARHMSVIRPGEDVSQMTRMLDQMAAKIAADRAAGRQDQAEREMRQLSSALKALESAQPMSAAQEAQAQAAAAAAQALNKLILGQTSLLDATAHGDATPAAQGALRGQIGPLQHSLNRAGIPGLPGLAGASAAMGKAQSALARVDDDTAQSAQGQAIMDLQQAAAALAAAAQRLTSLGQGGEMPDGQPGDGSGDNAGEDLSHQTLKLQGGNQAGAVEQEIMQRDSDPALPQATHDYLRRLLTPAP